jgi:isocitrate dehydrogenase (NAD+)
MMLDYLGETKKSKIIQESVEEVLAEGKYLTKDLGGDATTKEYTNALVERIKSKL